MAEAVSDSEVQAVKPPPKRRRILDPSAIIPVPVYSSKVSSSLNLKPMMPSFTDMENTDDGADEGLWSGFSSRAQAISISDSDEEEAEDLENKTEAESSLHHSPSPPQSPITKHSRRFLQNINKLDRELQAVNSILSPEPRGRRKSPPPEDDDAIIIGSSDDDNDDDDDVILENTSSRVLDSPYSSEVREIPLKVRCRTDIHKIQVLPSTPLSDVVKQLSVILTVPPSRLLLMRKEVELPTDATVGKLGLGIADIIECDVMAAEEKSSSSSSNSITVKLQSKHRNATQEFSLNRDAPLGSIFSKYKSDMSAADKKKVHFHFDGSKVSYNQTPAQLDMEDGDIIEVWT